MKISYFPVLGKTIPQNSFAVFATYTAFVINITYKIITAPATINPISSPITENIKSVVLGYKKPNCVWFPFNKPIPNNCPDPIASFDCITLYPCSSWI